MIRVPLVQFNKQHSMLTADRSVSLDASRASLQSYEVAQSLGHVCKLLFQEEKGLLAVHQGIAPAHEAKRPVTGSKARGSGRGCRGGGGGQALAGGSSAWCSWCLLGRIQI